MGCLHIKERVYQIFTLVDGVLLLLELFLLRQIIPSSLIHVELLELLQAMLFQRLPTLQIRALLPFSPQILQQKLLRKQSTPQINPISHDIPLQAFSTGRAIMLLAQVQQDLRDGVMKLFLHLLVVTAALLGLPGIHKQGHRLKDLVHPAHVLVQKMAIMDLHEPVVPLVLLQRPVAKVLVGIFQLIFLSFYISIF